MNRLLEMFEEKEGGISAKRVTYTFAHFCFWTIYAINCFRSRSMLSLNEWLVVLLVGMEAAKVWQRKVEGDEPKI